MCIHEFIFRYMFPWRSVRANSSINTALVEKTFQFCLTYFMSDMYLKSGEGEGRCQNKGGWVRYVTEPSEPEGRYSPSLRFWQIRKPYLNQGGILLMWLHVRILIHVRSVYFSQLVTRLQALQSPYKYWHAYSHNFSIISSIAVNTTPITDQ